MRKENNIFSYAFIGVLLFIAAGAFTLANISNIITFELSYTGVAMALTIAATSLLYKAIKRDRERLGHA